MMFQPCHGGVQLVDIALFNALKKEKDLLHDFLIDLCQRLDSQTLAEVIRANPSLAQWWEEYKRAKAEEEASRERVERETRERELVRLKKELARCKRRDDYLRGELGKLGWTDMDEER